MEQISIVSLFNRINLRVVNINQLLASRIEDLRSDALTVGLAQQRPLRVLRNEVTEVFREERSHSFIGAAIRQLIFRRVRRQHQSRNNVSQNHRFD